MQTQLFGAPVGSAVVAASGVTLRPYQNAAIAATFERYAAGDQRTMVVLPTGAGKTIVSAELVRQMLTRDQGRVLFLAHREELIFQTVDKMKMVLGADADIGVVKAEYNEPAAEIVVASIQTVQNRKRFDQLGAFGLVIADEAHHVTADSWMKVLDWSGVFREGGPVLFGMTATPDRTDGTGLKAVFESIAYERGIFDMIDDGYLVDIRAKVVQISADFSRIRVTRGDYNAGDSGRVLMQSQAPQVIARAYREHASDRQAIVFVPTVEVAYATTECLEGEGVTSATIEANTPVEERRDIMARMHAGTLQTVCNVGVLTEGTDIPSVSAIVLAQPTKSRLRYTQMLGRGLRLHPDKEDCLVLDLVGSVEQHRLQTVATLFGVEPKQLERTTVRLAKREQEEAEQQELTGEVVVRDVEELRGRKMHWIKTAEGQYVLAAPPGLLVLRYAGVNHWQEPVWDVWEAVDANSQPMPVHRGLALDYAQGAAEALAMQREGGESPLTNPRARWRNDPVTDKQLKRMAWMGIPTDRITTKGEASDAMNAAEAMKRLRSIGG